MGQIHGQVQMSNFTRLRQIEQFLDNSVTILQICVNFENQGFPDVIAHRLLPLRVDIIKNPAVWTEKGKTEKDLLFFEAVSNIHPPTE